MSSAMKVSAEIESLIPYKPGKPIEETQREYGLDHVVKLASNENPLGPSPKVVAALQKAIHETHRYPDASSYNLAQVASKYFDVTTDRIVFGNGSNELIDLLVRLYCLPGDKIVTTQSAFIAYKICAQAARVDTVEIPLGEDLVFDIEKMAEYMRTEWNEKHKVVFIPNPNNPTGTYVNKEKVDAFLSEFGRRDDMMIVFDEAYSEFVTADDHPNALDYVGEYKNVVVLRTLSKAYGLAGLRLGILFSEPEVADYLNRIRMPFNVNLLAQEAAIAALEDREYVERAKQVNAEGLAYLCRELDDMGISYIPSQGNFLLFDTGRDSAEVIEQMLQKGVILRPLRGYGFERHVRISVGLPEENEAAIAAMKTIFS